MAVEYQANMFLFFVGGKLGHGWAGFAKDPALKAIGNARNHFTTHYVHDLESVYWQFLWFICSRLPSGYVAAKTASPSEAAEADLAQIRKDIQRLHSRYFGHHIEGHMERRHVILQADVFLDSDVDCLQAVYADFPFLLAPINLCTELQQEYVRLEHETEPRQYEDGAWRFAPDSFRKIFYETLLSAFQLALDTMGSEKMPVQDLFLDYNEPSASQAEQLTFSSLRPAKRGTDAAGVERDEDGKGEPKRQRSKLEERDVAARRNDDDATASASSGPTLRRSRRISGMSNQHLPE
jgi:hypothetical protein